MMQLVIDISKEKYAEIMSMDWVNCRRFFDEEIRAIHDGKVLPAGHDRLIDAADEYVETEKESRWIPVSERLPKAGEYIGDVAKYYLVQNEYGDMLVARYTHSEYWEQIYQLRPVGDEIIAWMPLPEPYKAESEE